MLEIYRRLDIPADLYRDTISDLRLWMETDYYYHRYQRCGITYDSGKVHCYRSIDHMSPLAERHSQKPGEYPHEVCHIRDIGRFRETGAMQDMLNDAGNDHVEKQPEKHPVRAVGVLVRGLALPDAADQRIGRPVEQGEGRVVPQESHGMPDGIIR